MSPRRRFWSRVAILACLVAGPIVGLAATRGTWLPWAAQWLDVGEAPRPCDYVMVLGGEENTRPFVAAALINVGLAKKAILTEVKLSADMKRGVCPAIHEINRRILVHRGVDPKDIQLIGEQLTHTHGEAEALAEFLQGLPDARVTVVTSNYHTRRSRWVFRRVLGRRSDRISFVSAPSYRFRADNWWRTDRGVQIVVGEYLKLLFYGVRYGRLGYWGVGGCLAAVLLYLAYRRRRAVAAPA